METKGQSQKVNKKERAGPVHEEGTEPTPDLSPELLDYRRLLQQSEAEAQRDYDKAVMTLSGGALAITFAFYKDIAGRIGVTEPGFLLWAWSAWAISLTLILISFFTSQRANRTAIRQLDANKLPPDPGGKWNRWTFRLNLAGGLAFVIGVACAIVFGQGNLHAKASGAAPTTADTPQTPTRATPGAENTSSRP